MRNYIFDFDQQVMMDLDLSLQEALLLDYLTKFFDSGYAVTKYIDRRKYCWITYKKMLDDLPILRKKERQARRVLVSLEQKGLIKRHLENKNRLYIYVNQEFYFMALELLQKSQRLKHLKELFIFLKDLSVISWNIKLFGKTERNI